MTTGRHHGRERRERDGDAPSRPAHLRVLTYNIHRGRGADGRVELARIADVIAAAEADVAALQEVNVLPGGSQADELAARLGMAVAFAPCLGDGARHGVATLSRLPIERETALAPAETGQLPQLARHAVCALAVRVAWNQRTVEIVNTHLSPLSVDRSRQLEALFEAIAAGADELVVCGGLGGPRSATVRRLRERLDDAGPVGMTWPAPLPVVRVDHLLYRGELAVEDALIPRDHGARWASDHLPLLAAFRPIAS